MWCVQTSTVVRPSNTGTPTEKVADRTEHVEIGPHIDGIGVGDRFGRHVERRTGELLRCASGRIRPSRLLDQAEVEELDDVALAALRCTA